MLLITYFSSEKWCTCPTSEVFTAAVEEVAPPKTISVSPKVFLNSNSILFATGSTSSLLQDTNANKAAGTWIFRGFNATTKLASGTELPIANLINGGWQGFSIKNDANTWIFRPQYPDAVVLGGGKNAPESEDWYVSKPLFFTKVTPDTGTPIQYISGNRLDNYKFFGYDQPGTYTVTFVASNASVNEQKFVVKQLEITITP